MYVDENLNKAVAFLNQAREAKAAAVVVPPDTSVADTSVTDTSVVAGDSIPPAAGDTLTRMMVSHASLVPIRLQGNRLFAGTATEYGFAVVSVDGTRAWHGTFRGSLDLSRIPSGVYAVVVKSPSGAQKSLKFFKK